LLRNAISCSRSSSVCAELDLSKIVAPGQNVMIVPVFFDAPVLRPCPGACCLGVVLFVLAAVAVDLDVEAVRERVHHRGADAVEAAGDLVALAAELPAGVQHREDHLGRRLPLVLGVVVDRHPAAVVGDATAAAGQEGDVDAGAVTRHRLIDGVVDDLMNRWWRPLGRSIRCMPGR
jgi:hypothetical protein